MISHTSDGPSINGRRNESQTANGTRAGSLGRIRAPLVMIFSMERDWVCEHGNTLEEDFRQTEAQVQLEEERHEVDRVHDTCLQPLR